MRKYLLALLLLVPLLACGLLGEQELEIALQPQQTRTPAPTVTPAPHQPLTDKWDLWVGSTHLRGAVLHPCRVFDEDQCYQTLARQDLQDLRNLGANLVNASYPGIFSVEAPYQVDEVNLQYLDNLIQWAEEVGLFVVIHYRTGPGRNEAAIHLADDAVWDIWTNQSAHDAWLEMWQFTAERYQASPVVVGYNLMVEPHVNAFIDPQSDLSPQEFQDDVAGSLLDWNAFAAEMTAAIREIDPQMPIIVNSLNWADAAWFPALVPTGDERTVYSLHAYAPDVYTTPALGEDSIQYPSVVKDEGQEINFEKSWLEEYYRTVLAFSDEYALPIFVGEFGTLRWVPGGVEFHQDQISLFEQYGWNYAYYVWRGNEPGFDGFNLELGTDPDQHTPIDANPLLDVHTHRWFENQYYPALRPD